MQSFGIHKHAHSLKTYTHTHSLTHSSTHARTLTHTHTHSLSLSHTHTHTHSLTHTRTHTNSHTHTHTHTLTHALRNFHTNSDKHKRWHRKSSPSHAPNLEWQNRLFHYNHQSHTPHAPVCVCLFVCVYMHTWETYPGLWHWRINDIYRCMHGDRGWLAVVDCCTCICVTMCIVRPIIVNCINGNFGNFCMFSRVDVTASHLIIYLLIPACFWRRVCVFLPEFEGFFVWMCVCVCMCV